MIRRISCDETDALIKKGFLQCTSDERLSVALHSAGCKRCSDGIEERGKRALAKITPERLRELDTIAFLVHRSDHRKEGS